MKQPKVAPTAMRLAHWQESKALVSEFKKLLELPIAQHALAVLNNESPVTFVFPDVGITLADRAVHQAKIEGYHAALANLEALGTYVRGQEKPLIPTFAPANAE